MNSINEELKCKRCGSVSFELRSNGPHLGAYCTECGSWIKWVSRKSIPKSKEPSSVSSSICSDLLDKVLDDESPF